MESWRIHLAVVVLLVACGGADVPTGVETVTAEVSTTASEAAPATSPPSDAAEVAVDVTPDPDGLRSLVEGHNDVAADRVNLVVAAHAFPDEVDAFAYASQLIAWDGPVRVGADGWAVPDGATGEVVDVSHGTFAIEPFRSRRDDFNVWFTDLEPPSPVAWGAGGEPFPVDLPNQVVATLAWDWEHGAAGIPPDMPPPPALPTPLSDVFVGLTMAVTSPNPVEQDQTLAHELGHSVFNLPDHYAFDQFGYDGRPAVGAYPSCAEDVSQADAWWGSVRGVVDPALDVFLDDLAAGGLVLDADVRSFLADDVRIGDVANGCFGPEGVAVRASYGGLMYDEHVLPVMNRVDRCWSERFLDAWLGRDATGPRRECPDLPGPDR